MGPARAGSLLVSEREHSTEEWARGMLDAANPVMFGYVLCLTLVNHLKDRATARAHEEVVLHWVNRY